MKRWKLIAVLFVVIIVGGVAVAVFTLSDEPSWHGKTLTEWIDRIGPPNATNSSITFDPEAAKAIREIGTNALPAIIRMLASRDSVVRTKYIGLMNGQKLVRVHIKTAAEKQMLAMLAIPLLGTNAIRAAPQLLKLAQAYKYEIAGGMADCLLPVIAPEPRDFLLMLEEGFKNPDAQISRAAAGLLQRNHPKDAERLDVYAMYPDLKPPTGSGVQTNAQTGSQ